MWWANKPGSTLFMPVGDASEECLGIMALMIRHGAMVVDHETGEPAGDLEPFVRSGLLDPEKRLPLAELLSDVHESVCVELAFMGHNIVLMLQALGLGGLYFNGADGLSALGANADDGVAGLGLRFVEDDRWVTPNPLVSRVSTRPSVLPTIPTCAPQSKPSSSESSIGTAPTTPRFRAPGRTAAR
jgi:hypothetical protein